MFFICADGKKTALVSAVRAFWITADRDGCTNFWQDEICFTKMGKLAIQSLSNVGIQSLRSTRIQAQTALNHLSRSAVILNERFRPHKQRLSSISTNEKRETQAQPKILKRERPQLTRIAQTKFL